MTTDVLIRVEGLVKHFNGEIHALNGVDALLATLQMPSGIPVATVALGSAGPVNAALFAVQILALSDAVLAEKLDAHKRKLAEKVAAANARVNESLAQ